MRREPHFLVPTALISVIALCFVACGNPTPGSINSDPFKLYQASEIEADEIRLSEAISDLESVGLKFQVVKKSSGSSGKKLQSGEENKSVKWDEKAVSAYKGKVSDLIGPLEAYLSVARGFLDKYGSQYRIEGEKVVKYHTLTQDRRDELESKIKLVKQSLERFDPTPQEQDQFEVEFDLDSPSESKKEGERSRAPRNPLVNPGPLLA